MISILLIDSIGEEAQVLESEIRYLLALHSNEPIALQTLVSGQGVERVIEEREFLHMALVDAKAKGGLEAAAWLRRRFPKVQILILADQEISPLSYLTPAILPGALLLRPCARRQRQKILKEFFLLALRPLPQEETQYYWAKTGDGIRKIPYSAILCFEARQKRLFIRTESVEYGTNGTIERTIEKLPPNFIRCHRSYIINEDYIERIRLSESNVYLRDQIVIPISRTYRAEMKELINDGNLI